MLKVNKKLDKMENVRINVDNGDSLIMDQQ